MTKCIMDVKEALDTIKCSQLLLDQFDPWAMMLLYTIIGFTRYFTFD